MASARAVPGTSEPETNRAAEGRVAGPAATRTATLRDTGDTPPGAALRGAGCPLASGVLVNHLWARSGHPSSAGSRRKALVVVSLEFPRGPKLQAPLGEVPGARSGCRTAGHRDHTATPQRSGRKAARGFRSEPPHSPQDGLQPPAPGKSLTPGTDPAGAELARCHHRRQMSQTPQLKWKAAVLADRTVG